MNNTGKENYEKFNDYLNSVPMEILRAKSAEDGAEAEKDFKDLKEALALGMCSYCGDLISIFSETSPCFHWLLKPAGLKTKHLPLLLSLKSFHQIEAYVRWVANCDVPIKKINDLSAERSKSKIIEETIQYKNLEWSFSCSAGCMSGESHKDVNGNKVPHYHFQMKVNGMVVVSYGQFHIPFSDHDNFCFAVERGEFDRLRGGHVEGAGMQSLFENFTPEEILNQMSSVPSEEGEAQFQINTVVIANEGSTISGDSLADLFAEHKRTGIPLAKLVHGLKDANIISIIEPGAGVPEIAGRKERKRGRKR